MHRRHTTFALCYCIFGHTLVTLFLLLSLFIPPLLLCASVSIRFGKLNLIQSMFMFIITRCSPIDIDITCTQPSNFAFTSNCRSILFYFSFPFPFPIDLCFFRFRRPFLVFLCLFSFYLSIWIINMIYRIDEYSLRLLLPVFCSLYSQLILTEI